VGNTSVNVFGTAYRLAVGTLLSSTLNLGGIRQGGAFSYTDVGVRNIAEATDVFSDNLGATISGNGPFVGVGAIDRLAPGAQKLSGGLQVGSLGGIDTGSLYGVISGTLSVAYTSQARAGSGLGDATPSVAGEILQVTGAVYQPGTLLLENGSVASVVDLGRVRLGSGDAFQTGTVSFGNGAREGLYSEFLEVAASGLGGMALVGGGVFNLAGGSWATQALRYSGDLFGGTPGFVGGTLLLSAVSKSPVGLGDLRMEPRMIEFKGQLYTGQGVWLNGGTSSLWSDWKNWTVSGGRPGMDGERSIRSGDTALIVSTAAPIQVELPQSTLYLAGLTLGGSGGVSLNGGGTLVVSGTVGSRFSASGGAHVVAAAVALEGATGFDVGAGSSLSIGGLVSGGAVRKTGMGVLALALGYSSMQETTVSAGQLNLGNGQVIPSIGDSLLLSPSGSVRSIYLEAGASLGFNVGQNVSFTNLEIRGPGAANAFSLDSRYLVTWKNGSSEFGLEDAAAINIGTLNSRAAVRVQSATFEIGDAQNQLVFANDVKVSAMLGLQTEAGRSFELSGVVSGTGSVEKTNMGTVVLSGSNSYVGGTNVRSGTLEVRAEGALGAGSVSLGEGSALVLDLVTGGTLRNSVAGTGELIKSGSSLVVLAPDSGVNRFSGGTTISAGTLEVQHSEVLGSGIVKVSVAATLLMNVTEGTVALSNPIDGAGEIVKASAGTLLINGSNKTSGGVKVLGGTLVVESAGALGSGGVTLAGGVLKLAQSFDVPVPVTVAGDVAVQVDGGRTSLQGVLQGNGTLRKEGAGALQVGGVYVGEGERLVSSNVQIDGLRKGGGGAFEWSSEGKEVFAGTAEVVEGSVILRGGNAGNLLKTGRGVMVLAGSVEAAGYVSVKGGSLIATSEKAFANVTKITVGDANSKESVLDVSALSAGLQLAEGQTLMGGGTIKGTVHLASGVLLAPGNSVGSLTVGTLTIAPGVVFNAEYKLANLLSGTLLADQLNIASFGEGVIRGGIVIPRAETSATRLVEFTPYRFSILNSVNPGTWQFDSVRSSAAIVGELEYFGADGFSISGGEAGVKRVDLVLKRVPYEKLGGAGNRGEVGRGLDLALKSTNETFASLFYVMDDFSSQAEVQAVLAQLNPKAYAEVYSLALSRLQDVQKSVNERLTQLGTALGKHGDGTVLSLSTGTEEGWTGWTNAYGSWLAREANPGLGDGGFSQNSVGEVTGVERRMGGLTFGFIGALGTGSTQINLPSSSISSESWHLGMYASTPLAGCLFGDALVTYGEGENVIKRTQNVPTLDGFGNAVNQSVSGRGRMLNEEWLLQLGVGAQVAPMASRWSVVPSVRLAYAGVQQKAAREKMNALEALGIQSDANANRTMLMRSAVEIAKEGFIARVPVRATASAAWVHDFLADPRRLGVRWQGVEGASWLISTERRSSDALRLGAALEIGISDRRTLRLYGEQEYLNNTKVLRGGLSISIGF
jgi:autotransporter-associated beta strand protein